MSGSKHSRPDEELLRVQLGVSLKFDDFVFIRPDGSPINPTAVMLAFSKVAKKAGLPHLVFFHPIVFVFH